MVPAPVSCRNANFTLRFYPYVIVGYGVAGQAALKALLERDPGARVLVIDASSDGVSRFTPLNSSGEPSSTKSHAWNCYRMQIMSFVAGVFVYRRFLLSVAMGGGAETERRACSLGLTQDQMRRT